MNAVEAVRTTLTSTQYLVNTALGDLSDADLLIRPVPAANHIAWQLGHLILAERNLLSPYLPAAKYPELPVGFSGQHGKDTAAVEPPKGFATKAEYLDLFNRSRAATLAALEPMTDAEFDKPTTGPMAQFAPTLGALLQLQANHTLMHAGQFT